MDPVIRKAPPAIVRFHSEKSPAGELIGKEQASDSTDGAQ
jgi:hypothetical protein